MPGLEQWEEKQVVRGRWCLYNPWRSCWGGGLGQGPRGGGGAAGESGDAVSSGSRRVEDAAVSRVGRAGTPHATSTWALRTSGPLSGSPALSA